MTGNKPTPYTVRNEDTGEIVAPQHIGQIPNAIPVAAKRIAVPMRVVVRSTLAHDGRALALLFHQPARAFSVRHEHHAGLLAIALPRA